MKEVLEAFFTKIRSPVFGYFLFAWVVVNWKELALLFFSENEIEVRVRNFETSSSILTIVIYPVLFSIIAAVSAPWIKYLFLKISEFPTNLRNNLQANTEHVHLLRKLQLEELRNSEHASAERELIEQGKRDAEIMNIKDVEIRVKLQKDIESLRAQHKDLERPLRKALIPTDEREKRQNEIDAEIQTIEGKLEAHNSQNEVT